MQKQDEVMTDAKWDAAFKYPPHCTNLKIFRMFGHFYNYDTGQWERVFAPGIYTVEHVGIGYYGPFGEASCSVVDPPPLPKEGAPDLGWKMSFKANTKLFKKFWLNNQEAVAQIPVLK